MKEYSLSKRCPLILQMAIYFNCFMSFAWIATHISVLQYKFGSLSSTFRFLTTTGYVIMFVIEFPRLYLGYIGNLFQRTSLIMGFWLLTSLIQFPIQSFLLFSPQTKSIPLEVVIDSIMFSFIVIEVIAGGFSARNIIRRALKSSALNRRILQHSMAFKMAFGNGHKTVLETIEEKEPKY